MEILKKINLYLFRKKNIPLPKSYQIEASNICNLKCPLCPNHIIAENKKKHLTLSDFKTIISQIPEKSIIYLSGLGEPLLNPDIFEIINTAKQKKNYVYLSTNLFVSSDIIEKLIDTQLDKIIVSIDGFSEESYLKYRVNSDFKKVFNNLLLLKKLKEEKKSKVKIVWQYIVNKFNEKEVIDAISYAKKYYIDIAFIEIGLMDALPQYKVENLEEVKKKWLPENKKFISDYYLNKIKSHIEDYICPFLWTTLTINSDLKVYPCCNIYDDKDAFGDLRKNTLEEIWNNEIYRHAREKWGRFLKKWGRFLFPRGKMGTVPISKGKNGDGSYKNGDGSYFCQNKKIICEKCENYLKGKNYFYYLFHFIKKRLDGTYF